MRLWFLCLARGRHAGTFSRCASDGNGEVRTALRARSGASEDIALYIGIGINFAP